MTRLLFAALSVGLLASQGTTTFNTWQSQGTTGVFAYRTPYGINAILDGTSSTVAFSEVPVNTPAAEPIKGRSTGNIGSTLAAMPLPAGMASSLKGFMRWMSASWSSEVK